MILRKQKLILRSYCMTEPGIPIENIYYLLCYAWNQLDEAEKVNVSASDYSQYIDLFAKVLKNGCSYILKRGLDREYIEKSAEIPQIKGKIGFNEYIKNSARPSTRIHCFYDQLSHDVLHNQIIKATIRSVLRVKYIDNDIRRELTDLYKRFLHISDISLTASHFKKVRLNRNNLYYRFILNVAYIVYENIVLDERTGKYEFVDFVRDEKKMARLYENFVRNFFKEELKGSCYEVASETIKWNVSEPDSYSLDYLPIMKTDISLTSPDRKIIIDTKYYKECLNEHYDREKVISSNLYQIFAYVKNAESQGGAAINSEGMLLYPTVTKEIYLPYQMENHKIVFKTINLNQNWKLIKKDLLRIVNN